MKTKPVFIFRLGGFVMLLTVEGYFEAGRFIADTPIQIY
jgi:hypothetical protein